MEGLPATYVEDEKEAQTLELVLYDALLNMRIILSYTLYENEPVITRSVKYIKDSGSPAVLKRVMSMSIDFPDYDFDMVQFSGAWARERHPKIRRLEQGVQSVYSMRGARSAEHNPFLVLKRPDASED